MHIISEKAMTPHSSTLAWKIHIYKSFSTMLEKEHQKKKKKGRQGGEIGKCKLNELEVMNMK